MTYVEWIEKPEHVTHAAVSKPPSNAKALAKQAAAESREIEYSPEEHLTNIRVAGLRNETR